MNDRERIELDRALAPFVRAARTLGVARAAEALQARAARVLRAEDAAAAARALRQPLNPVLSERLRRHVVLRRAPAPSITFRKLLPMYRNPITAGGRAARAQRRADREVAERARRAPLNPALADRLRMLRVRSALTLDSGALDAMVRTALRERDARQQIAARVAQRWPGAELHEAPLIEAAVAAGGQRFRIIRRTGGLVEVLGAGRSWDEAFVAALARADSAWTRFFVRERHNHWDRTTWFGLPAARARALLAVAWPTVPFHAAELDAAAAEVPAEAPRHYGHDVRGAMAPARDVAVACRRALMRLRSLATEASDLETDLARLAGLAESAGDTGTLCWMDNAAPDETAVPATP